MIIGPATNGRQSFLTLCSGTPPVVAEAIRLTKVSGDYYEFGVFAGFCLHRAQKEAQACGLDYMNFWGFDSFQGLPEVRGVDASTGEFKTGDYACDQETVEILLSQNGIDWSRTKLIPGWYDESLKPEIIEQFGMKPAAVVLVDCDIYSSTVPVLKFLSPLLQAGTIILFDDYNNFKASDEKGERLAFKEFLQEHSEWRATPFKTFGESNIWTEGPHGQSFIMEKA